MTGTVTRLYRLWVTGTPRVPPSGRWLALGVSLACLAVLITAMYLTPSPAGVGSHTQLGLAKCQFLHTTGIPAPTCGMTTSFSWFVRGNLLASVYVQPMGAVLAAITLVCVVGGLYVAVTGRPVYRLLYAALRHESTSRCWRSRYWHGLGKSSFTATDWMGGAERKEQR